jgi:opacity protein-like surface antigen
MKKLLFVVAFAAATVSVKAQDEDAKPLRFSLGADVALPMGPFVDKDVFGDFSDNFSLGLGASAQVAYALDTDLGLTFSLGYMSYMPKEIDGEKGESLGVVPVQAGIEYNFTPQFFASAQLGYNFYTGKALSDSDLKMSGFSYAPGIGYRFTENFSAQLRYQGASVKIKDDASNSLKGNLSQIGLRIAYSF